MNRFLKKLVIFLFPFLGFFAFTYEFYDDKSGDIKRAGYLFNSFPNYRENFSEYYHLEKYFDGYSDRDTLKQYDVLTIGDSFSEQGITGYQNFLAKGSTLKVLHFERKFHRNPVQTLFALTNGDFFENIKVKIVVLEMVERHFIESCLNTKEDSVLNVSDLKPRFEEDVIVKPDRLLSNRIFKFPFFAISRNFIKESELSKVYEFETKSKNFSVNSNQLFIYRIDINNLSYNNSIEKLERSNFLLQRLNKSLHSKGIQLVVVPAPNKFSFYYSDIKFNSRFDEPLFFKNFLGLNIQYKIIFLSPKMVKEEVDFEDFYYFDDSHWSPKGAEFVSKKIFEIIGKDG
ncbi:alginate O-acetyltransferase AlgX-related protein [Algoriphagus mannitolivorans]|uniref:alginate O-acetyltransferase AlgX-related protein n=1 Tax=Algoriphagus mannitolivorans TaxID=226504 RepID=UPI000405F70B|nr:hypothetical protein [Algoriphagus mannitolivorans]